MISEFVIVEELGKQVLAFHQLVYKVQSAKKKRERGKTMSTV